MTQRTSDRLEGAAGRLSPASQEAVDRARSSRQDLRSAIGVVREALSSGSSGRGERWYAGVRQSLADLGVALEAHIDDLEGPEGLYVDLLAHAPWQGAETEILETEHQAILDSFNIAFEASEAAREAGLDNLEPVQRRVETLLERIVLHGRREADLVYEVYTTDIGLVD